MQLDKSAAANKFEECLRILDKLEPAIRGAVSQASVPPPPPPPPPPGKASPAADEDDVIEATPLAQIQSFEEFQELWPLVKATWQSATQTIDDQIVVLQAALRETDDEDLHDIAEFGLGGVTGNFRVPFVVTMRELDACNATNVKPLIQRLLSIGENFTKYLASAEVVAVCDDNEFGVTMTIKDTLTGAIDEMKRVLSPLAS